MATLPIAIVQANQKADEHSRLSKTKYFNKGAVDLFNGEYDRFWKHIKKQNQRIEKMKLLIKGPETERNASYYAEIKARILKCEIIVQKCIDRMKQRQEEKNRIDNREFKKLSNRQKVNNNEAVRLERSKLVQKIKVEIPKGPKDNSPDKITIFQKSKRHTSKNPDYVEVTQKDIENQFRMKLEEKPKKKRDKLISEPFPYMKRKRILARNLKLDLEKQERERQEEKLVNLKSTNP